MDAQLPNTEVKLSNQRTAGAEAFQPSERH